MIRRLIILGLAILLFGAAKLPFERQLAKEYSGAGFHQAGFNMDVREQAGQMGFVAALSGFRAIVADMLWIRAHIAWEHTEWGRMKLLFDSATSLQPRALMFWTGAAHHMAWNAAVAAMQDKSQPRIALRRKAAREYMQIGEQYLLRGAEFNPQHATIYDWLGSLYRDRMNDHCRASWAFFEAAKRPDAMQYVHRVAVYELARCPGHEREAYDMLVALYHKSENERLPTLLKLIDTLQETLKIPREQWIDTTADWPKALPR